MPGPMCSLYGFRLVAIGFGVDSFMAGFLSLSSHVSCEDYVKPQLMAKLINHIDRFPINSHSLKFAFMYLSPSKIH